MSDDDETAAPEQGYTVGEWNGLPNHECKQCPYSSLDEWRVLEHIAERHLNPFGVDRFGNPLPTPASEEERLTQEAMAQALTEMRAAGTGGVAALGEPVQAAETTTVDEGEQPPEASAPVTAPPDGEQPPGDSSTDPHEEHSE